jgi:hypothetical protein
LGQNNILSYLIFVMVNFLKWPFVFKLRTYLEYF